jgi:hypothetical protein
MVSVRDQGLARLVQLAASSLDRGMKRAQSLFLSGKIHRSNLFCKRDRCDLPFLVQVKSNCTPR